MTPVIRLNAALAALFLLVLLPAAPVLAAFTDNSDGTVTDDVTGLMWDQCSWGQTGNTCTGSASYHNWAAALALAITANSTSHRGYNDWRLPNRTELESLVDITKATGPTIDTTAFPNTPSYGGYWTSTTYAPDPAFAWSVDFNNGYTDALGKTLTSHVRLVRSGQSFGAFDAQAPVPPIPTLSEWAMILLGLGLAGAAFAALRRRGNTAVS